MRLLLLPFRVLGWAIGILACALLMVALVLTDPREGWQTIRYNLETLRYHLPGRV